MSRASVRIGSIALALTLALAACIGGGGSGGSQNAVNSAKGPIKIWYSNNAEEVAWGKAVVTAWNKDHPKEQVTGEEIPAGKSSEEVIGASITAGNTPCLIFNTAPAAVPQFQKQGGLVALDDFTDGASYIKDRTGDRADQYKFTDGKFYQLFPSKNDPENLLEPGVHRFPRGKLGLQALGPEGKEYFWAYLSPTRKSFAGALMGNGPYAAAPATVSTVRSLGEVMLSGRFGASDVATIVEVD